MTNPNILAPSENLTEMVLRQGYCIIPAAIDTALVAALAAELDPDFCATPMATGLFYGAWTKRFHRLLSRSSRMEAFVLHPEICRLTEEILGPSCDKVQLNLTQAIEIFPGGDVQPPHRDQEMWPVRSAGVEYLINVMWPFTEYTEENGATIVWPGSNHHQEEMFLDPSEAIVAEMNPGDALIFLGSTLHAGGANRSTGTRRGMIISYSLGWLKPYELPWLAYPPEVARTFSPALAQLAGYQVHRPNLGTYEGRCPSSLLKSGEGAAVGAVDALQPAQIELITQFYADRQGGSGAGKVA